nr:hypothetical protein [Tanacetum cinerariifolium]
GAGVFVGVRCGKVRILGWWSQCGGEVVVGFMVVWCGGGFTMAGYGGVKLQEYWWKINAHEVAPFTRLESYSQRPYAYIKTEKAHDPYLKINSIFGRNYGTSNDGNIVTNSRVTPSWREIVSLTVLVKLASYTKRDTTYQRQVFTRKRVFIIPNTAYSPSAIWRIHLLSYVINRYVVSTSSIQRIDLSTQNSAFTSTVSTAYLLYQTIRHILCLVTTWDDLVEKFVQKFYPLSDHNDEIEKDDEIEEDDDPDDITDIFKIEGNLFKFETPLCEAFNDFNYLLKIDKDLFTFDIPGTGTYKEYELNNPVTRDLEEPWLDNGVPYQLYDHICKPYCFKNGVTKWPTCSSDIYGFCNGGELPRMVRVRSMTYFQDHKWYDELADERLKEETLMHKEKVEESWGYTTPYVMKFYAWLIDSFGNFHELDYNVLVKLQECWWKINTHEVAPFSRSENYGQRQYVNFNSKKARDPYLEINNIFGRNYDTSNAQDNQGHEKRRDDPTLEPSVCKIKRFEMMKYSFNADEEYMAIKESKCLNYSKDNLDAYRELLRIINEGWVVATPDEE